MVQHGCSAFLDSVVDKSKESELKLENVHIFREFPRVFLEELPGLPPDREIKFVIELALETTLISKAPYLMAPVELKELKNQLQELLDKGLLSKVKYDIGDSCSLDYLIDSIFPLVRKHIEPDLHHAQVGRMTLGGLLGLGYNVVVSYKRASMSVNNDNVSISLETIDTLGYAALVSCVLKFFLLHMKYILGTGEDWWTTCLTVGNEASKMGVSGLWLTKSYLEIIIERKGVPRLNTPPLLPNSSLASNQDKMIIAPKPIRVTPNLVNKLEDLSQPWTRSPKKSKMEPVVATWHFISSDPPTNSSAIATTDPSSFKDTMKLAPLPNSYDLDRGLLLSALLENKGFPVIVGIGLLNYSLPPLVVDIKLG
ncbi:uncharacterized protein LOC133824972 [Humulus lupulus]|uniref:uncharacterized protein LOC133824972 n=1 Tax=Humulus lupulus TaxID=3486 RepID=UPI002B403849|nr:uncharacterized protein LOC133824972 [Humulus lupulus]